LAVRVTCLRSRITGRSGSTRALLWFETNSTAPDSGTSARPSTSIRRKNKRSAAPASFRKIR